MSFTGALTFCTNFIEKLHINLKPFHDFLHENTTWNWTDEHERLFQTIKSSLTSEKVHTIPNTRHPFFNTVDDSLIGLGPVSNILQLSYIKPQEQNFPHLSVHFLV